MKRALMVTDLMWLLSVPRVVPQPPRRSSPARVRARGTQPNVVVDLFCPDELDAILDRLEREDDEGMS